MVIYVPLDGFVATRACALGTANAAVRVMRLEEVPEIEQGALRELLDLGPWPLTSWVAAVPQAAEAPRRTLDRVLIALKLLVPEYVNAHCLVCDPCDGAPNGCDLLPHYVPMGRPTAGDYTLTENAIAVAEREWGSLFQVTQNFGVSRFHIAEHRAYCADVFVDLALALEFLLAPEDRGLAYWCRLGAALLTHAGPQRTRLVERIDALYDLRSAIVHGDDAIWTDDDGVDRNLLTARDWAVPTLQLRAIVRDLIRHFAFAGVLNDGKRRKRYILDALFHHGIPK